LTSCKGPGHGAIAALAKQNLAACARTTPRAVGAAHPCPAVPQTGQATTVGGPPARLLGMPCPAGGGFPVELAVTTHDGTAFAIASQNPTGTPAAELTDRAAFHTVPAGIRIQR
jgi:hypothetical protein